MSSTYRVLCLSHDPAVIAADGDWNRAEPAEAAIAAGIEGHERCDLLIGRYSYPLVELGCPTSGPKREGQAGRCYHRGTKWADVDWIRLLFVAQQQEPGAAVRNMADAAGRLCWTPGRLLRLRNELGLDEQPEPTKDVCGHQGSTADPHQPCTLPLGHDLHRDADGYAWLTPARVAEPGALDVPCRLVAARDEHLGHYWRGWGHVPPVYCPGWDSPEEDTEATPAPCSVNHDCPGQPRPEPLTARGEARCQSQYQAEGEPLVQCALKVHPGRDAHTDYDSCRMTIKPPHGRPADLPWIAWCDKPEEADRA